MDSSDQRSSVRARRPRSTATRLRVVVSDELGRPVASGGLPGWLARVAPQRTHGAVHVALVRDSVVRALNKRYRNHDAATDVLSFPSSNEVTRGPRFWGDIVIARGVARRQAREHGHNERVELRVLALHGFLHLLGYDHENDDGRMARMERRLRRRGGLPEGLIDRTSLR
jgi:probable rRNA maturation factor